MFSKKTFFLDNILLKNEDIKLKALGSDSILYMSDTAEYRNLMLASYRKFSYDHLHYFE